MAGKLPPQPLLTGKRQYAESGGDGWAALQLGDFLTLKKRLVTKTPMKYSSLGVRSHGKGTFRKAEVDPEDTVMTELYRVKRNDLIVNITFAWEGAIAIVKAEDEDCLVSHRFPTYEFDLQKAIPEFFQYLMLTKKFLFH